MADFGLYPMKSSFEVASYICIFQLYFRSKRIDLGPIFENLSFDEFFEFFSMEVLHLTIFGFQACNRMRSLSRIDS